ncbi:hypothetical protein EVAR_40403_1 [Eumeta japonica]|uniref:Uncharacterized protein n=1 Tax=Eumeta variegata TaxID=151549 RepID=A0A4C1WBY4_EUMVA|nr:hypothetical protein EVAR_40403_1 [Eumeta japonica]
MIVSDPDFVLDSDSDLARVIPIPDAMSIFVLPLTLLLYSRYPIKCIIRDTSSTACIISHRFLSHNRLRVFCGRSRRPIDSTRQSIKEHSMERITGSRASAGGRARGVSAATFEKMRNSYFLVADRRR